LPPVGSRVFAKADFASSRDTLSSDSQGRPDFVSVMGLIDSGYSSRNTDFCVTCSRHECRCRRIARAHKLEKEHSIRWTFFTFLSRRCGTRNAVIV
jgi:hypothetical protein